MAKRGKQEKRGKRGGAGRTDKGKGVSGSWMNELRYGRTLSVDFFKNNAWLMVIIVVFLLALMGLRYKTKTKMVEIKQLTMELQRAESHKLHEKSLYMSTIRETEMVNMVKEKKLNLQFQEQPPYELEIE